jgi:TIR domain
VSDGRTTVESLEPRLVEALRPESRIWVLPLMPADGHASTLHSEMQKQNVGFWKNSIAELALTVLARAGVTSLDRRVFISYRRIETEPMAGQLFEALTKLNFSVFLDTVSIDPGVDFQARLFEQLADKSMVLLLHSRAFSRSRWTLAEADFAREHDLSLLMLQLPDLDPNDSLIRHSRAGDVVVLDWKHLASDSPQGGQNPPFSLTEAALEEILKQVVEQHDVEVITRLVSLRERTLEALNRNSVKHRTSMSSATIFAESSPPSSPKSYSLFPTSRPPGLPELYDASTRERDVGDRRIVIGRLTSFNAERVRQMDWTIGGRNVAYADVSMLDVVAQKIKAGSL